MREWISQQGMIFYIFTAVTILGVIATAIANRAYKRLAKEADSIENADNRLIKYIKLKYSSFYKIGVKPNDTWSMVSRYLYKYRLGPLTLEAWSGLSLVAVGIIATVGAVRVMMGFNLGEMISDMYAMMSLAFLCMGILLVQRRVYRFESKKENFRCVMCDYLNNYLRNKMEFGATLNEQASQKKNQAAATAIHENKRPYERDAMYKKHYDTSLGQSRDEEIDAKIVEDILKEFLN